MILLSLMFALSLFGVSYVVLDALTGQSAMNRNQFQQRLSEIALSSAGKENSLEKRYFYSDIKTLEKILRKQALIKKLSIMLELTGWGISVSSFVLASLLGVSVIFYFMIINEMPTYLALTVSGGALYLVPSFILKVNYYRYVDKFSNQFPKALQVIRGAIQAGLGLNTSLERVALDCPVPLNKEFRRVLDQMTLGKGFIEALASLRDRIRTTDTQTFYVALSVQQESGGNLAELLANLEETISTRVVLRKELRALTAQGRASGFIIALLPIAVFVLIRMANPTYMEVFESDLGKKLLIMAGVLQAVGFIWIQKIVSIRIKT